MTIISGGRGGNGVYKDKAPGGATTHLIGFSVVYFFAPGTTQLPQSFVDEEIQLADVPDLLVEEVREFWKMLCEAVVLEEL